MALGSTKWETAIRVVLPAARVGVFGACVLDSDAAAGRNDRRNDGDRQPAGDLGLALRAVVHAASVIANEFTEAHDEHLHERAHRAGLDSLRSEHGGHALARFMI